MNSVKKINMLVPMKNMVVLGLKDISEITSMNSKFKNNFTLPFCRPILSKIAKIIFLPFWLFLKKTNKKTPNKTE